MNVIDVQQGSPEWLQARAGKVTASKINDVLATIKTGEAKDRRDYKAQLVAEILTGTPQGDDFKNAVMQWGTEQEPYARAEYEMWHGVSVDQVGLVIHPTIARGAASPDGLIGEDGLIEIKCPKTATHIQYLLSKEIPVPYQKQMLWQLACTGRTWCDFVSYDPRMPEGLSLFVKRFHGFPLIIQELENKVIEFINEVEECVSELVLASEPAPLSEPSAPAVAQVSRL